MFDVLILGGGAAGFYAAVYIVESDPHLQVAILERGKDVLAKVKVSGGGRCNVTHAEFDPRALARNYPRGEKELLGPFHKYASGDTMAFFEERGVPLKIEEDGRMFPVTDSSQTIIDCLLSETERLGIKVLRNSSVTDISRIPGTDKSGSWCVQTLRGTYTAKKVLVATGSNPKIWGLLKDMGHTIVSPVPSLFTFNIKDDRISGIPGVSTRARISIVPGKNNLGRYNAAIKKYSISRSDLETEGPLLITHWGLSGPGILRLSAWGALLLNELRHRFAIHVNWVPDFHEGAVLEQLQLIREIEGRKTVIRTKCFDLPKRLWSSLVRASNIGEADKWVEVSKTQLHDLAKMLSASRFIVNGKSTFKEEFVTAGGVDLREIDFKSYESKILPNLYFAGEVMNVDAITGGFNFQNAWTGAYIAARAIAKK